MSSPKQRYCQSQTAISAGRDEDPTPQSKQVATFLKRAGLRDIVINRYNEVHGSLRLDRAHLEHRDALYVHFSKDGTWLIESMDFSEAIKAEDLIIAGKKIDTKGRGLASFKTKVKFFTKQGKDQEKAIKVIEANPKTSPDAAKVMAIVSRIAVSQFAPSFNRVGDLKARVGSKSLHNKEKQWLYVTYKRNGQWVIDSTLLKEKKYFKDIKGRGLKNFEAKLKDAVKRHSKEYKDAKIKRAKRKKTLREALSDIADDLGTNAQEVEDSFFLLDNGGSYSVMLRGNKKWTLYGTDDEGESVRLATGADAKSLRSAIQQRLSDIQEGVY